MKYIEIGAIANTHGLKGTLKVKSFTDFKEERYKKGNTLYLLFKQEYIPVTVKGWKTVKNLEYIDFKEFTHINQVEHFKGASLYVSEDDIHEIEDEDTFYVRDLIGLDVFSDTLIGQVKDVRDYPQGSYLDVRLLDNKKVLIPFKHAFIKEVDIKNNRITIIEWEGLL
jgi:16S rRNA processing protein RimM